MDYSSIWYAVALTVIAGLSTGMGGLFTLIFKETNAKLLSVVLGFSAGVMIYVSFVELYSDAMSRLTISFGKTFGMWVSIMSFFGGMLLIAVIDKLIPSYDNPHESRRIEEFGNTCEVKPNQKLLRTGILTALAITIHNFPEGMATFMTAIHEPSLGLAIAIAVAIHNIPEGIAVAIPVYCASGSRKKALVYSFLSGLSEPFGALVAYLILMPFLNDTLLGIIFAAVAGIMIFISLDELLPTAREYGEHHLSMYGLILGMALISFSLALL